MSTTVYSNQIDLNKIPLYNSFQELEDTSWFIRNRYLWLVPVIMATLTIGWQLDWMSLANNDELDKIALTVDFSDVMSIQQRPMKQTRVIEIDEIFGNQYIKKEAKEEAPVDANAVRNAKIAGAFNPVVGGASLPANLNRNPPGYPAAARAAGIEGRVVLEVIIADTGRVLRARPVGKKLGKGLEQAAASYIRRSKFKPSFRAGKAVTVKLYIPVMFKLN